jgi:hypothetical protein
MLKCSKNQEGTAELEEALATMLDIIKSVNDSMHQIAITGFEVSMTGLEFKGLTNQFDTYLRVDLLGCGKVIGNPAVNEFD